MKRFLTQRESERCEMASEPVCKCRCGGAKHGAGRIGKGGDFSALPQDDPHYLPSWSLAKALKMINHAYTYVQMGEGYATSEWHDALTILRMAHYRMKSSRPIEGKEITP